MFTSWRLGKAFGIDLYIHATFWLLPALVLMSGLLGEGIAEAFLSVAVVLALFACVLLHELGHSLAARVFGIGTRDITLYPIGGVARLERMSERPYEELVIALAGPAVNVIIAILIATPMFLAGLSLVPTWQTFPIAENFLLRLVWLNIGLVVFNMIPAFPMDGGRVFRSILAMFFDRLLATRVAVFLGAGIAALFVCAFGWLLLIGEPVNPMLPFLGVIIFLLGQQELWAVKVAERRRRYNQQIFGGDPPFDPAELNSPFLRPSSADFTGHIFYPEKRVWIEWRDGEPVRVSVWRDD